MPSIDIHCKISKKRTENDFRDLHEWIDEPRKYLGPNHRIERHSFHEGYRNFIKSKWGDKGVVEWLFHIALDNMETANKFATECYNSAFDEIIVTFKGKEIKSCTALKSYTNSRSLFSFRK